MRQRLFWYISPVVIGALGACGGGGGGSSATTADAPAPVATASPSPTASASASPSPGATASPTGFAAQAAAMYDVTPDLATCRAGTLKAGVKQGFLADLNRIRALHGLPAVTYSSGEDAQEADSSLMMAANRALSHEPPAGWTCYSASGASGAGASNLIIGWGTGLGFASEDDQLAGWLNEGGSASIGHRRWILSPFLGKTSYGRVSLVAGDNVRVTAASMRVFGFSGGAGSAAGVPGFVAYPFNDYPVRYFRPTDYLSFTAIASGSGGSANGGVRYTNVRITVTGPNGALAVSDVSSDYQGFGVPNSLQWRVSGLQAGTAYTVRISGVTGTPQVEYSYGFRIVS